MGSGSGVEVCGCEGAEDDGSELDGSDSEGSLTSGDGWSVTVLSDEVSSSEEGRSELISSVVKPVRPRLSYQACGYLGFGLRAADAVSTEVSSSGLVSLAIITSLAFSNSLLPIQVTSVYR